MLRMGMHHRGPWLSGMIGASWLALGCGSGASHPHGDVAGAAGSEGEVELTTPAQGGASSHAGAAGESGAAGVGGAAGAAGAAGASGAPEVSVGEAGSSGGAAEGEPETPERPEVCVPSAAGDTPDAEGADTDCDGIDGSVSDSVFVSPRGSDAAAGTLAAPVATLATALQRAVETSRHHVLICTGRYEENLLLQGEHVVSLHGGYDCSTWARTAEHPVIAPNTGVALRIEGASSAVVVSELDLVAPNATAPGGSAEAVQVLQSGDVAFQRCTVRAGDGAAGLDAAAPKTQTSAPARAGAPGGSAIPRADGTMGCALSEGDVGTARCKTVFTGGEDSLVVTCADGTKVHPGYGGDGALFRWEAVRVEPTFGLTGAPGYGPGSDFGGQPGAVGGNFGAWGAAGYVPSNDGGAGKMGKPGASGNGGMGGQSCMVRDSSGVGDPSFSYVCTADAVWGLAPWNDLSVAPGIGRSVTMYPGTGGGQGGWGGCGGYGGLGGKGGGASLAMVVSDSRVTLTQCVVTAGRGGRGGAPSAGSKGQPGGKGGAGGKVVPAGAAALPIYPGNPDLTALLSGKPGQDGSSGYAGGPGGPGGGGPSVALLWKGTAPVVDELTMVHLTFEGGGEGGSSLASAPGTRGLEGAMLELP